MSKLHRIWTRLLAVPFILWFGVTTSGPLQFSVCPMHETHAASGSGMTHGAHHAVSHSGSPTTPRHHSAQQCTCPSECGGGGVKGMVAGRPIKLVSNGTSALPSNAWQAAGVAYARAGFLTPFANGPPWNS